MDEKWALSVSCIVFTARIRRMGEGNIFSLSTLAGRGVPHPRSRWGGGVPHPRSGWWGYPVPGLGWGGGTPSQVWMVGGGYPVPGLDSGGGGNPSQVWMVGEVTHPIRHSSIVSTCYTAGGVPLAFTQEDFLV